jgi:hypothetical protein
MNKLLLGVQKIPCEMNGWNVSEQSSTAASGLKSDLIHTWFSFDVHIHFLVFDLSAMNCARWIASNPNNILLKIWGYSDVFTKEQTSPILIRIGSHVLQRPQLSNTYQAVDHNLEIFQIPDSINLRFVRSIKLRASQGVFCVFTATLTQWSS